MSDENDDDPTHLQQIFAKESVDCVLNTIGELIEISPLHSPLADSNMLFAAKVRTVHRLNKM